MDEYKKVLSHILMSHIRSKVTFHLTGVGPIETWMIRKGPKMRLDLYKKYPNPEMALNRSKITRFFVR